MRYDQKQRDPFYASTTWKRLRRMALIRDHYLCQRCRRRPANTVHHMKPREEYPELALVLENLQSVCAICHNREHPEKGWRNGQAVSGPLDGIRVIDLSTRRGAHDRETASTGNADTHR